MKAKHTLLLATLTIMVAPTVVAASNEKVKDKKTEAPTSAPTHFPTAGPTNFPSFQPVAAKKQKSATLPTRSPTAVLPTRAPVRSPTAAPSISATMPTLHGTAALDLTTNPTQTTVRSTVMPSAKPTRTPIHPPTPFPSAQPNTKTPTSVQPSTHTPTSAHPTQATTVKPTRPPTVAPNLELTEPPSIRPTHRPSWKTTRDPTLLPTATATLKPSVAHSSSPSTVASSEPSTSQSQPPSYPPIDFHPRSNVRPGAVAVVRITNVELAFRGVPMVPLEKAERRQMEALTTDWLNSYYHDPRLVDGTVIPHLQVSVLLVLQKLEVDTRKLLLEISLGSTEFDISLHRNPSSLILLPWNDTVANDEYTRTLQAEMADAFDGLEAPMDVPVIRTPTITLPDSDQEPTVEDLTVGKIVLGFAGGILCLCAVAVTVLICCLRMDIQRQSSTRPRTIPLKR